jgi:hypothetical protein
MSEAITYLQEMNIRTSSRISAVQDAGATRYDAEEYRRILGELTGTEVECTDDEARYVFMYGVEAVVLGTPVEDIVGQAKAKATKFVAENKWVLAKPEYDYEPKNTVDALGKPKQRKGAKKAAAIKFWKDNQDNYTTRKEWIEALSENVGLTAPAASTYHHNLSKGKWV